MRKRKLKKRKQIVTRRIVIWLAIAALVILFFDLIQEDQRVYDSSVTLDGISPKELDGINESDVDGTNETESEEVGNISEELNQTNETGVDGIISNETNDSEVNESLRYPEPNETSEESIEIVETPAETPTDVEVTFFFFHASYCATCQTMLPWIREVANEHPTLNLELVDLHSGSPYVSRFRVTTTVVSVILREEDGVDVSGTKKMGFMDKASIERFICTELDDEKCNNL